MVSGCGPALLTFCRADLGAAEEARAVVSNSKVRSCFGGLPCTAVAIGTKQSLQTQLKPLNT